MDVQQNNISQVLQWLNSLTLPTIVAAVFAAARWLTKKEDTVKSVFAEARAGIAAIRDNHLHHIQESMDRIEQGQTKATETLNDHTREIVAAQNQSTTAIVQAILSTRK